MDRQQLINECLTTLNRERSLLEGRALLAREKALKIKEYKELDKQEREISFLLGKKKAEGKSTKDETVQLKMIRDKKLEVLAKNKIDPSTLSPAYQCKTCGDTGYVNGTMCKCLKERINRAILKASQAEEKTLSNFKDFKDNITTDEKHRLTLLKLKTKLESIAKTFPVSTPKFMILSGSTGVGKTFLSECLASSLIARGYIATFISAFAMNNIFLSYVKAPIDQKNMVLNTLLDPDLLIIDDLGTEPILKNITLEYLYLVLSERARTDKLTVFTTNLDLSQILDRYQERIFSRIVNKRDSFNTHIQGPDLRLR